MLKILDNFLLKAHAEDPKWWHVWNYHSGVVGGMLLTVFSVLLGLLITSNIITIMGVYGIAAMIWVCLAVRALYLQCIKPPTPPKKTTSFDEFGH